MKYMVSVVISPCILPRANLPHLLLSAFFQDRFLLWSLRTIDSLFVSMGTIHVMKFCGIDNVVELLLSWNMVMISNYFCFDCSFSFFSSYYGRVGSVYIIIVRSIFIFLIYILSLLMMSFRLLCLFSLFVWSNWLDLPDCIIMAEPAQLLGLFITNFIYEHTNI